MSDLRALISDTIHLLKSEHAGKSLLVSPESAAFFQAMKPSPVIGTPPSKPAFKPTVPPAPAVESKKGKQAPSAPSPLVPETQKEVAAQPIKTAELPPSPKRSIEMEPIKASSPKEGMEEMRALLARIAPEFQLHSDPLNDEQAKKIATGWEVTSQVKPVVILSLDPTPGSEQFLQALSQAIHTRLIPCTVISALKLEKEKKWEALLQAKQLKWILSPPLDPLTWPLCLQHYLKNPTTQEEKLGNTRLISLQPWTAYTQNPALKAELWRSLCQLLKS